MDLVISELYIVTPQKRGAVRGKSKVCPTAKFTSDGTFRLLQPNGYDPNAERWEFPPSTMVRCVTRKFADGYGGLVAVACAG